ncbi:MAG: hypothetical protein HYZ53_05930 [Planctomycetes bacterium]|nr:hypothetical protein [Planctomycetota bacterium]
MPGAAARLRDAAFEPLDAAVDLGGSDVPHLRANTDLARERVVSLPTGVV